MSKCRLKFVVHALRFDARHLKEDDWKFARISMGEELCRFKYEAGRGAIVFVSAIAEKEEISPAFL